MTYTCPDEKTAFRSIAREKWRTFENELEQKELHHLKEIERKKNRKTGQLERLLQGTDAALKWQTWKKNAGISNYLVCKLPYFEVS